VDIFAWGATMVFAATGQSPFEADTLPVIINRILNEEPNLSALQSPLREVVGRCLSKDPALRPPAHQLLLQLLGNAGVAPGPAPAREDLLDQGTRIASQLPAPPPVTHRAPPPPQPIPRHAPPPAPLMTPPPMAMPGPGTPPPMAMPGPRTPPPMAMPGPRTPPPMAMPMHGPATPPPMRTGPPGPPMTQPPFRQGYQPPPRRSSKGPIIAMVGCGGLAVMAIIIFVVAVLVGRSNPQPTDTYTPFSYGPTTSNPNGISSDLGGTWSGTITSAKDSTKTWDAKIVLFAGLSTGSVTYTGTSKICSGLLSMQESTSYKVTLKETITIGRSDCSDGYVQLYPGSSSTRYEWREDPSDGSPSWSGTLTKQ
jgi:hypothetical protein